jgi:hypothetical protein
MQRYDINLAGCGWAIISQKQAAVAMILVWR